MKFIKKPFILLSALTLTLSLYSSAMADQPAQQAKSVESNVPNPVVTGPIPSSPLGVPSHNYPQLATSIDLSKYGYIEKEFFFEGKATRYSTTHSFETATSISTGHPYKSRMLVRRPASPEKFNGKVIVEWLNVTSGYNLDAMYMTSYEHYLREGYAYVGVSAQRVGIHQPGSGLKSWSPARYETLDVTDSGKVMDDGLAFDIYSQAAQALLNPVGISPLGNLKPELMIAAGASQSEGYLVRYYNSIHPLTNLFDGYMMYLGVGVKLRTDLDTKVIKVNTENDLITLREVAARQDDSDVLRTYEVAGASHVGGGSDYRSNLLIRDGLPVADISVCEKPALSRIPTGLVVNAAYEHLARWIEDGIAPPKGERIQVDSTSPAVVISRDSDGNALGGIRLPQHEVPTATNTGSNSGAGFCFLFGSHEPFSEGKLKSLYRNHGSYVSAVTQAANDVIKQGFLLKEDAKIIREEAAQSKVGK
jgi:hypothetical protein